MDKSHTHLNNYQFAIGVLVGLILAGAYFLAVRYFLNG